MLSMLNDDGKCYSFDSRGSGYGRSEGVATIILKRLDDALAAGDPVRAIIRNTGINQDGKTNGILLPSSESQEILVRSLYKSIQLNPAEVGYVEAHGTGTVAGDAAEIESISKVFCSESSRERPLFVGSIKANIGHLESASGLAGILKTVMALEQGVIPPVPNVLNLKKNIKSGQSQIKVSQKDVDTSFD
jgi:acyl transferase domain-containing protein